MNIRVFCCFVLFGLIGASCAPHQPSGNGMKYSEVLNQLTDSLWFARLNTPGSSIVTSYDRTGKNNDYNWFVRKEKGWVVLADLKGPGVLTKFWFTGTKDDQRFRFYLDGEKIPSVDVSLKEMRSGHPWFPAGPANYEDSCWCSYVPIPYNKSLTVMTVDQGYKNDGSRPKIFYQINYTLLDQPVESMPVVFSNQDKLALEKFVSGWDQSAFEEFTTEEKKSVEIIENDATLVGKSNIDLQMLSGPGIIRNMELEPDFESVESAVEKERLLRDVILRVYWEGAEAPSVEVPMGDFFGSIWKRTRFQSRFFGMNGTVFNNQFPMPFSRSARIELENRSGISIPVRIRTSVETFDQPNESLGYFHSVWKRSETAPRPHSILNTKGTGKFAGCIFSVTSFDKSWWILESDEVMIRDGENTPCWHGTGLEDYFNSSWYYKNVFTRPLHGLLFKAPFRTVQYRIHRPDPVSFAQSMNVTMERGPDQASRGTMESTAFYYLSEPMHAESDVALERSVPNAPETEATLMGELANLERLGDYQAAYDSIDAYLAEFHHPDHAPLLRLRQIALVERMEGINVARPMYEDFIEKTDSVAAKKQAQLLLWFHESPDHVLLSFYCKNKTSAFIDGRKICEGGNAQRMFVLALKLASGKHAVSLESVKGQYPDWVHACIRTHSGLIFTDTDWRYSFTGRQSDGKWRKPGFDDSSWYVVHNRYVEGPPPFPYVWMEPHSYVDMHSRPLGVWISELWPEFASFAVFRKEFTLP